jgi:hypothetical protein
MALSEKGLSPSLESFPVDVTDAISVSVEVAKMAPSGISISIDIFPNHTGYRRTTS